MEKSTDNEIYKEEICEKELLFKAMLSAKKTFENVLENMDVDPAYFSLDLIGKTLFSDFRPNEEITLKDFSTGTRKIPDWEMENEDDS